MVHECLLASGSSADDICLLKTAFKNMYLRDQDKNQKCFHLIQTCISATAWFYNNDHKRIINRYQSIDLSSNKMWLETCHVIIF